MPPLRRPLRQGRPPGACLSRGCPFVYSYEAWGHTYVGCMQKVYEVEIDLDMLRAAEARKPGFGAIRAIRRPLPMCKAEVERTYESRLDEELGASTPSSTSCPSASRPSASSRASARPRAARSRGASAPCGREPRAAEQHRDRRADRERVDRTDPEPGQGDDHAVERAVPVLGRDRDERRLEVQVTVA